MPSRLGGTPRATMRKTLIQYPQSAGMFLLKRCPNAPWRDVRICLQGYSVLLLKSMFGFSWRENHGSLGGSFATHLESNTPTSPRAWARLSRRPHRNITTRNGITPLWHCQPFIRHNWQFAFSNQSIFFELWHKHTALRLAYLPIKRNHSNDCIWSVPHRNIASPNRNITCPNRNIAWRYYARKDVMYNLNSAVGV